MTALAVPVHSRAKTVKRPDLPQEILGQPVTYVEKPILTKGRLVHPKLGWEYEVDDSELDLLVEETTKYINAGNKPFLPERHMEKFDAKSSFGYLIGVRRDGDELVGLHQLIGEDAKKYAARNDTSVLIEFGKRDGRGNKYKKVITHNALCPDPVDNRLGGFIGMSMSGMGAVPVLAFQGNGCNQYGCPSGAGGGDSFEERMKANAAAKVPLDKAASKIGIPPKGRTTLTHDGSITWTKRGGYAGEKTIQKVEEKAIKAGFRPAGASSGASPGTGQTISQNGRYEHPDGHKLTISSSYGVTARDNSYYIRLDVNQDKPLKFSQGEESGPLGLCEACGGTCGQTARGSAEVRLTEQQLATARELLGGTDVNEENVFERMVQALKTTTRKLAASVSVQVPDDSMMFMLKPTIDAKRQAALLKVSKATVDAVMAPFEKEGKLQPIAFSQSGDVPLVYAVLDGLAKNEPIHQTRFGSQALSQSLPQGGGQADDEEVGAADAVLRANGMLPPLQKKEAN